MSFHNRRLLLPLVITLVFAVCSLLSSNNQIVLKKQWHKFGTIEVVALLAENDAFAEHNLENQIDDDDDDDDTYFASQASDDKLNYYNHTKVTPLRVCNRTIDVSNVPSILGQWVKGPKWYDSKICCGNFKKHDKCTNRHKAVGGDACLGGGPYHDHHVWQVLPQNDDDSNHSQKSCFSPSAQDFSKQEYCANAMPSNRTLLLVGDSTMQQTATILKNALIDSACHDRVQFALSDRLVPLPSSVSGKERGKLLVTILDDYKAQHNNQLPDVVILTVGAHIHDLCVFDNILRRLQNKIFPQYPETTFVYKTQNPAGCSFPNRLQLFHPENPTLAATDEAGQLDKIWFTHDYHRQQFWMRDDMAISTFMRQDIPILDVRMLYSRTDSKVYNFDGNAASPTDCLHYRSPGPLDNIVCSVYDLLQGI